MVLIKCPECGKEVSGNAPSCPKCGYPITATTIEKTAKKWKTYKLIAVGMFILGLFFCGVEDLIGLGVILIIMSPIVFWGAKIGSWWHHG